MKLLAKLLNVILGLFIIFGIPYLFNRPSLYAGTWLIALVAFYYLDEAIDYNIK